MGWIALAKQTKPHNPELTIVIYMVEDLESTVEIIRELEYSSAWRIMTCKLKVYSSWRVTLKFEDSSCWKVIRSV